MLYVMLRPPSALASTAAYNPINTDALAADFGMPYLRYPDPQPKTGNGWPGAVDDTLFDQFKQGDPTPYGPSMNLSWFRVLRKSAARFIVTCGAGASRGYKDWNEVRGLGAQDIFGDDARLFQDLANGETRLWYEIEWSAAVTANDVHNIDNEFLLDHYQWKPFNASHDNRSQAVGRNLAGTIRWAQRLDEAPTAW
jgi:hypothetical protein